MGLQQHIRPRIHQARVAWAPSPLRLAARHRYVRAAAIVGFGLAVALTWSARVAALDQERALWGELTAVLVVVEPVDVGALVTSSVEVRDIPLAMAPDNSLATLEPEALAKSRLYPGEVLLADRVTLSDALGPPAGTVALTLSTVATAPLVRQGDLIDVWAVDSANFSSRRITQGVAVLSVASDEITIAVPESQIADTTAAALRPVVITLVG